MKIDNLSEGLLPEASARDIATILFKRKWSIFGVVAATMVAFFLWLFLIRDETYVVTAKVLVKIGREQTPPPSINGASPMVIAYRSQDVNSEIDIFQSTDSIGKVVDELHLDRAVEEPVPTGFLNRAKYETKRVMRWGKEIYEELLIKLSFRERLTPREKTIFGIARGLVIKAQKDSNVFVAELALPYRRGSAQVLNALLDHYLVYRQQLYSTGEGSYFTTAVEKSARELRNAEAVLQRFENMSDISSLAKQESVFLEQSAAAHAAWKEADATRQEFAGRIARLEEELQKEEPNFPRVAEFGHPGFQQTILIQLAQLQQEREKLRMTELDSGDKVTNNRNQFQALTKMLAANLKTAHDEVDQQTAVRRLAYENLKSQLRELHEKQSEWTGLRRRAKDAEDDYFLYRRKSEEANANSGMELLRIGNVAVIERAGDPLGPAGIRKTTLLGLAALAAILAALTWVTVAEFFDQSVYTVEELEKLTIAPVLAAVPRGPSLEASGGGRSSGSRRKHDRAS